MIMLHLKDGDLILQQIMEDICVSDKWYYTMHSSFSYV